MIVFVLIAAQWLLFNGCFLGWLLFETVNLLTLHKLKLVIIFTKLEHVKIMVILLTLNKLILMDILLTLNKLRLMVKLFRRMAVS